jgi:hypothetical protein
VLLLTVGGVTAWRVADRLAEPAPGDSYEVTFTVDRMCGSTNFFPFDGLSATGHHPELWERPDGSQGSGVLTIDEVHGLPGSDGIGFTGTLVTDDGLTIDVHGGTEGEYFFTLDCPIGGG